MERNIINIFTATLDLAYDTTASLCMLYTNGLVQERR